MAAQPITVTVTSNESVTVEQVDENLVIQHSEVILLSSGVSGSSQITRTAAENLGGNRVVAADALGEVVHADSSNTLHADRVLGITTGSATTGNSATIRTYGEMNEATWAWTPGSPIYLSTNGQMTQTPPLAGFVLRVAKAETATRVFIDVDMPILRE